jgi:hypothetical protein
MEVEMGKHVQAPERLVRAMAGDVDVNVEKRILERAVFVTRNIASDGGIVVPDGIKVKFFEQNPVVLDRHARVDGKFPVIGRSLSLASTAEGMESRTQFADTESGREIAYLYGVNEDKEVYARGWSYGWTTVEVETWTLAHAKEWLGADYDEDLVPTCVKRWDEVWVSLQSIMNEYSVVPLGADKKALSRAFEDKGVEAAGRWVAVMDLAEARQELARIKMQSAVEEVRNLTRHIEALSRDGAAAAGRGDSAAVLDEVRELVRLAGGR